MDRLDEAVEHVVVDDEVGGAFLEMLELEAVAHEERDLDPGSARVLPGQGDGRLREVDALHAVAELRHPNR